MLKAPTLVEKNLKTPRNIVKTDLKTTCKNYDLKIKENCFTLQLNKKKAKTTEDIYVKMKEIGG